MSNAVLIAVVISLLLGGGGLVYLLLARRRPAPSVEPAAPVHPLPAEEPVTAISIVGVLADARQHYYKTAFSAIQIGHSVPEGHKEIVAEVRQSLDGIAGQERLLPRRPMLMPQLLRALNDPDSTRNELAGIILQDPVLAADVLKIANSPYYRIAREPVDSIDRAIVLLGTDGLKSVVAASILQPVFRLPKGQFEAFAPTLWEFAMRTSTAAGVYAGRTRVADHLTAHLLGLLAALGPLALFRLTSEIYRAHPGLLARPETFIHLIDAEGDAVSSAIASHWQLPETFVLALAESKGLGHIEGLSPLGRALEAGRCCALLSLAPASGSRSIAANKAAMAMGLETTAFDAVWAALNAAKANMKAV